MSGEVQKQTVYQKHVKAKQGGRHLHRLPQGIAYHLPKAYHEDEE